MYTKDEVIAIITKLFEQTQRGKNLKLTISDATPIEYTVTPTEWFNANVKKKVN